MSEIDDEKDMLNHSIQDMSVTERSKLAAHGKCLSRIHGYTPEQIALHFFVLGRRTQQVTVTRGDMEDFKALQKKLCDNVESMIKIYAKLHKR